MPHPSTLLSPNVFAPLPSLLATPPPVFRTLASGKDFPLIAPDCRVASHYRVKHLFVPVLQLAHIHG